MRKRTAAILSFILAVMFVFSSCMHKEEPEDVLHKLEISINTSDFDSMLECYEPSVQKMYKGMLELGGMFFDGADLGTILSGIGGFVDVYGEEFGAQMPKVTFYVNNREDVSDSKVRLNVTQRIEMTNSPEFEPQEQNMAVCFVNIDDQWYISARTF